VDIEDENAILFDDDGIKVFLSLSFSYNTIEAKNMRENKMER